MIGGYYTYVKKKCGLHVYCNPPLTPSIGPFFKNETTNPVRFMDKCKQISSLLAAQIDSMDFSVISFALDKKILDVQPFYWRNFKVIPQYTYILSLDDDIKSLWNNMSSEKRKSISKGLKDGLKIKKIDDYNVVSSLASKTFTRQNKAIDSINLNKVLFNFANDENSFAFAAYLQGQPVATTFCVHDAMTAYYLLGGYDSENKHHGAGPLCMWESVKYSKYIGLSQFDFEGSMVPPIEKYLRGFGGQLTPYYRVNKATLPLEIALKVVKRNLF